MGLRLLAGWGLTVAAVFPAAATAASPAGSFAAVVAAHFSRWDRNHDGALCPPEVTVLVTDPAVCGDEAAALAAIHLHQRNPKGPGAFTLEQLLHPATAPAAQGRRDQAPWQPNFEARFNTFRDHILKAPRELFVGRAPSLEAVSQGYLGDCYFLAAVGAAVHRDPAAVRRLFRPGRDGSCDLHFCNGRTAHVRSLTDAQIALGSSAGAQGLWLNVLEEGFGQVKGHSRWGAHASAEGLDAIARGGDAGETITLLTGHKAAYLPLRKGPGKDKPPPPRREVPALMAKVRTLLETARAGRLLVCCGTGRNHLPRGIASDHDYAVLDYEARTDTVLLWNPWGNHFTPQGTPGLAGGYATEQGHFRVPLGEFVHIFEGLYHETPHAVRKR
jgi:hypothetical protein